MFKSTRSFWFSGVICVRERRMEESRCLPNLPEFDLRLGGPEGEVVPPPPSPPEPLRLCLKAALMVGRWGGLGPDTDIPLVGLGLESLSSERTR